ncbi:MAG: alpha/beta hydrolase, partial [Beijerinckiaceae bacterium]
VAPTRRPTDDEGRRFGGERTLSTRYAAMTVALPRGRRDGEIVWPSRSPPDPAQSFAAVRFEYLPREKAQAGLSDAIRRSGSSHVLLFVHGYNTRFDEAAFRFAQIAADSQARVTPVLFSWPSWGSLTAYPYDRESAAISRDALEGVMRDLARNPKVSQVSVLAHSMGGWLTLEALRQMAIRQNEIPAKIGNVMLAAPDVDVDVASAQGRVLLEARRRPKMTLFVSDDDRALNASRILWGSRDRLGSLDPNKEPYRTNLAKNGVEVVNLSDVSSADSLNHGKFATSPEIVQLIGRRLAAGQKLEGPHSIGEGANAVTQGTLRTLGDVVTAPIRIVDPSQARAAPDARGISD